MINAESVRCDIVNMFFFLSSYDLFDVNVRCFVYAVAVYTGSQQSKIDKIKYHNIWQREIWVDDKSIYILYNRIQYIELKLSGTQYNIWSWNNSI